MAICKLNDMPTALSGGRRLLGLDVGKKTIGLAISDAALVVASVAVFLDPLSLCFVMKISLYAGGITAVQRKSRPVAVFHSGVQPVQC